MLNEYIYIQGFYKDTSFRKNRAQFVSIVHQSSPLPVGQYSGVEGGEWHISNDRESLSWGTCDSDASHLQYITFQKSQDFCLLCFMVA